MKEYNEDIIEIGDTIRYWVTPNKYGNTTAGTARYGKIYKIKHDLLYIKGAYPYYDWEQERYITGLYGEYSLHGTSVRPVEEVRKLGVEEFI